MKKETVIALKKAWKDWHEGVDDDVMPDPNTSFIRGFEAGWRDEMQEMLDIMRKERNMAYDEWHSALSVMNKIRSIVGDEDISNEELLDRLNRLKELSERVEVIG